MKQWKRLVYYLLINVLVSACVTWTVLSYWERTHPGAFGGAVPFSIDLFRPAAATLPAANLPTALPLLASIQPSAGPTSATTPGLTPGFTPGVTPGLMLGITSTPAGDTCQVGVVNVFGAGDLDTERVQLGCSGRGDIALEGWKLLDTQGDAFTFPQFYLSAGASVEVHTGLGVNTVDSLYWGLSKAVWKTGQTVTLENSQGKVVATYQVP